MKFSVPKTVVTVIISLASVGFVAAQTAATVSGVPEEQNAGVGWLHGPPSDPDFFPIGVWAQNPRDAGRYKELGVNLYLSLHGGPTEEQLATLKSAGMKTICRQNDVGLAHIDERMATPDQMRFEVWSAIIHGARGIIYFCHQWEPTRDFAAPLNNEVTRNAVTSINREVTTLAPIIHSGPMDRDRVIVRSSKDETPIATMQKRDGDVVYVFAAAMGGGEATASFELSEPERDATVRVIGEERSIDVDAGKFSDHFRGYDVHIYQIE